MAGFKKKNTIIWLWHIQTISFLCLLMIKLHVFLSSCLFFLFSPRLTNVLQLTHPISILSVVIQHILICVFNLTKSKVNIYPPPRQNNNNNNKKWTSKQTKNRRLYNTVSGQLPLNCIIIVVSTKPHLLFPSCFSDLPYGKMSFFLKDSLCFCLEGLLVINSLSFL